MPRPPLPTSIHEVTGAYEVHPERQRKDEPVAEGEAEKPKYLTEPEMARASRLWDEFAPLCSAMGTLKAVDAREFASWCCLEAEFEKDPAGMQSARIAQKRAYGERFGMSAGARAKMAIGKNDKTKDPADKYFQPERSGDGVLQ